eukprot:TRINITY_DN18864_c0_g1_i2.p1 TRINITY_DN18864_c0_g1~~TRINITY_DN18864_c0_g1_i2.p1  ORF type:complete len:595 (-),score=130.23 TRINITY_DN18864_c0_g1_i2:426-2210(-)
MAAPLAAAELKQLLRQHQDELLRELRRTMQRLHLAQQRGGQVCSTLPVVGVMSGECTETEVVKEHEEEERRRGRPVAKICEAKVSDEDTEDGCTENTVRFDHLPSDYKTTAGTFARGRLSMRHPLSAKVIRHVGTGGALGTRALEQHLNAAPLSNGYATLTDCCALPGKEDTAGLDALDVHLVANRALPMSIRDALPAPPKNKAERLKRLLESPWLEGVTCILILANAVALGYETQYEAVYQGSERPLIFDQMEAIFCLLFVLELAPRLWVHKLGFFCESGWSWNLFDFLVVALQVFDVFSKAIIGEHAEKGSGNLSSALRIWRLVRLVRIARMFRIVRFRFELQALISSILGSMQSLAWTLVLLFGLIYVTAVFFTQAATAYRTDGSVEEHLEVDMQKWFGSLGTTTLTLYQSVTGGVDWIVPMTPLLALSPCMFVLFNAYIGFTTFAIMNVVTGVFVERMTQVAQEDADEHLAHSIMDSLKRATSTSKYEITWELFEQMIADKSMEELFKALPMDPSEARVLFRLLDESGSGAVAVQDFVSGCLSLRGPTKSLAFQMHVRDMGERLDSMKRLVLDNNETVRALSRSLKLSRA